MIVDIRWYSSQCRQKCRSGVDLGRILFIAQRILCIYRMHPFSLPYNTNLCDPNAMPVIAVAVAVVVVR